MCPFYVQKENVLRFLDVIKKDVPKAGHPKKFKMH